MVAQSSPENPMPVRTASRLLGDWIRRTGAIWVEGQISQLRRRGSTSWITLRDTDADMSIPMMTATAKLMGEHGAVNEGDRVILQAKPDYFAKQGSLNWRVSEIRPVGIGALLAQIEQLKRTLAAEGLFDVDRKRKLPFLPKRVGLICGRAAAARQDVEVNARMRWPDVQFEVRETAVQGNKAPLAVSAALTELVAHPDVDVIVITRGGGNAEDLLAFSNETLLRAVAACPTPVVSAIGHEEDHPLLDDVADLRASTPTDAAKRIVPDVGEELRGLSLLQSRSLRVLEQRLQTEQHRLHTLTNRPVMAQPAAIVTVQRERIREATHRTQRAFANRIAQEQVGLENLLRRREQQHPRLRLPSERELLARLTTRAREKATARLDREREKLAAAEAQLRGLSPQSVLDRGYAVIRTADGQLLKDAAGIEIGATLDARLARGSVQSVVIGSAPDQPTPQKDPADPASRLDQS
ncbi:exodeoxyribonuclease VII large subunit [Candidatus Nanopelagicales bacterium]|nr:exodeoxyribonuclease VII large subunit [Candidatus Nanopelagicales bacterium]